MGIKPEKNYHIKLIQHVYEQIPSFTDIFNEETFYMFVVTLVLSTICLIFILSRFITLKPVD